MEVILGRIDAFLGALTPFWLLGSALLGAGIFLTLRLGFVQLIRFRHGLAVATGKYDDPEHTGDVSHFQALTTALSATVGVGNIAGVAAAIHWGGPGALFWMWVTAGLGMAVKFSEVTLALKYRQVEDKGDADWLGSVSGGPMYYIERGLGTAWKPLAIFCALALMLVSLMGSNALQANTLADQVHARFAISPYISGACSAVLVGLIMFGGIKRIGRVTSILMPLMAAVYVLAALAIIAVNHASVFSCMGLIFSEAFNPTSGLAGTGAGALLMTLEWGVRRGLLSNEAGQGSAPIAHAAAQTEEPVSEGVVALLEPFIDTLVICTITGLVILTTGTWNQRFPTELKLDSGDVSFRQYNDRNINVAADPPDQVMVVQGIPQYDGSSRFSWHEVPVDRFFTDANHQQPFSGVILVNEGLARSSNGATTPVLYGNAVETAAPLTAESFKSALGDWGELIVLICVVLFAISTAISWSYYGDRCVRYVFGKKYIIPYKFVFLVCHFLGAVAPLQMIWNLGDRALSLVTIPNVICLIVLSGVVAKETNSYFERKPWENEQG